MRFYYFFLVLGRPLTSTLFPYTTLFRSVGVLVELAVLDRRVEELLDAAHERERGLGRRAVPGVVRSEEHTSELQSRRDLVCRLLLEKKKHTKYIRRS